MSWTVTGLFALGYAILMPLSVYLVCRLQKKLVIERQLEQVREKKRDKTKVDTPMWDTMKERVRFSLKDTRPSKIESMTNAGLTKTLFFSGMIAVAFAAKMATWWLIAVGVILFIICVTFAYKSPKDLIETRKRILVRMYNIGRSKLGLEGGFTTPPPSMLQVTEWVDLIRPNKVEYTLPDTFESYGEESFLRLFNQAFGTETAWVADFNEETGAKGWDYENSKLYLRAVPPLPTMAKLSPHYFLADGVGWSFFPMAIGVENGLELPNPETGEIEHVLGLDLNGSQVKVAAEAGLKLSPKVTFTPQVLIGGGTGGGKALASDTLVKFSPGDTNEMAQP